MRKNEVVSLKVLGGELPAMRVNIGDKVYETLPIVAGETLDLR
jgi:hypothetical protein